MNILKRLLVIFGWALSGILSFAVLVYLVLLVINWNDRPPSVSALRLETSYRERPHVDDESNGYLYLIGFSVDRNRDPMQIGLERIAWAKRLLNISEIDITDNPGGEEYDFKAKRGEKITKLAETCGTMNKECQLALENANEIVVQWLDLEEWILDRYRRLLAYEGWLEPLPFDIRIPLPAYHHVFEGQKLLFLRAWQFAKQKDVGSVRGLLTEDIRFWRHVLAETDTLITKIIAAVALKNHFKWSNFIIKRLPRDLMVNAIPKLWSDPISSSERSMMRCLTGEWIYMNRGIKAINSGDPNSFLTDAVLEESSILKTLFVNLAVPLVQPQDFSNKIGRLFLELVDTLNVNYEAYAEAVDRARAVESNRMDSIDLFNRTYNLIGNIVFELGSSDFTSYAIRVSDLEGVRRAALLAAQIRSQNVPVEQVKMYLNLINFHNPYFAVPLEWDGESNTIVFQGLEPSERGHHTFDY